MENQLRRLLSKEITQQQEVHHRSVTSGKGQNLAHKNLKDAQINFIKPRGRIPTKHKHGGLKWLIMM